MNDALKNVHASVPARDGAAFSPAPRPTRLSIGDLVWLWRASQSVKGAGGLGSLKPRIHFMFSGSKLLAELSPFRAPREGSSLERIISERPDILGAVLWPYQCAAWPAETRLARIAEHYAIIDDIGKPLLFGVDERLPLLDLEAVYPDCRIILDQPNWFLREGGFALNIFVGEFRCYSLAFSLHRDENAKLCAYVGCMQGRDRPDAIELYRELTKAFYGVRPRDFLFEMFRLLCRTIGVEKIAAVADEQRHHRHPYFRGKQASGVNYDEIWRDRGGVLESGRHYLLTVESNRRPLEQVKPNKRSQYRKRYEFLDRLETTFLENFSDASSIRFADK